MVTVEDAVMEFLLDAQTKNCSESYLRWLRFMLKPLVIEYGRRVLAQLTSVQMRIYQRALQSQKYADETYRNFIRVAKQFIQWAWEEYRLPSPDPMARISLPIVEHRLPIFMKLSTFRRLVRACDLSPLGRRNRAILYFMADTGCRVGGVVNLGIEDVDLTLRTAVVREKGNRERVVPYRPETVNAMLAWIAIRPRAAQRYFCILSPGHVGKPLTEQLIRQMIKKLGQEARIPPEDEKELHPHAIRHMMALTFRARGGDPGVLAQIMGHSDVRTTIKRYGQYSPEMLVYLHQQFSVVGEVRADVKRSRTALDSPQTVRHNPTEVEHHSKRTKEDEGSDSGSE